MKRKRNKYRLVRVLCAGIIAGALLGMLLMGLNGRVKLKAERTKSQKTEELYQKEKEKLEKELAQSQESVDSATIAKENADKLASNDDDWCLVLVNSENPLDTSYAPNLTKLDDEHSIDSRIADVTKQMFQDAEAAGLSLHIVSAYRDYDTQRQVFNDTMLNWIYQGYSPLDAYDETSQSVAIPGTSEHATGLAMDITSSTYTDLDDAQGDTDEAKWLIANCANYGYILRYPSDKSDVTKIVYEPWHFRYVGKDVAKEITDQGITLEEYIQQQKNKK